MPSSSSSPARRPPSRKSSSSAAGTWRSSRRRAPWCSASCPGPRPARSRSSSCARRPNQPPQSTHRKTHLSAVPHPQEQILLREERDGICTLTMNRPQQMNLLTAEMLSALESAFREISRNRKIRVVVLAGAGKGFCAGHDLKEIRALKELPKIEALFGQCSRMMQAIPMLPQPVIARVHGAAAAAGCQLVAQCDLAIASEAAKFVTSGVTWGFFCSTPGVAVGRNLQRKHAMEMLLTGEAIDARRALEWGLVNKVVPPEQLDAEVLKLATTLAAKPPATVAAGKRAFYQQMDLGLEQAYALASGIISASFAHEEGRAGMEAFIALRNISLMMALINFVG